MTDQEAQEMLKQLSVHYKCRVAPVDEYCKAFRDYFALPGVVELLESRKLTESYRQFMLLINKSCLLDRMIYGGESPSKTPCPVHKGRWSGIHWGWPGTKSHHISGQVTDVPVEPERQKDIDAGCNCYNHRCGCTTGWQAEEVKSE